MAARDELIGSETAGKYYERFTLLLFTARAWWLTARDEAVFLAWRLTDEETNMQMRY